MGGYRIDGADSSAQVIISDSLPWWLAGAHNHLSLYAFIPSTPSSDGKVETATNSINRLAREMMHHLQYYFNCWMTTAAEDHICTYLLEKATKTKMNYTAFSGGGQVMSNLLGGHIDVAWANPNECIGQVKGGLVRMLAVTKDDRLALLPDVPTFKELGYDMVFWQVRGIHGPPNMPQSAIDWAMDILKKATETDTWKEEYLKGKVLTILLILTQRTGVRFTHTRHLLRGL